MDAVSVDQPGQAETRVDGRIVARATGTFGRFIVSSRTNHLVSDGRAALGAPGEAIAAGELLLSALGSCGLGLIQVHAAENGLTIRDASADVTFERDPEDETRYRAIVLRFHLEGVTQVAAEDCAAYFAGKCPIYNTLRRGGPISITVSATP